MLQETEDDLLLLDWVTQLTSYLQNSLSAALRKEEQPATPDLDYELWRYLELHGANTDEESVKHDTILESAKLMRNMLSDQEIGLAFYNTDEGLEVLQEVMKGNIDLLLEEIYMPLRKRLLAREGEGGLTALQRHLSIGSFDMTEDGAPADLIKFD